MEKYFSDIDKGVKQLYDLAGKARDQGLDPEPTVPIPLAKNMAERVEGLISVTQPQIKGSGISKRIEQLEEQYGKLHWKVAFTISLETAKQKFCTFDNELLAMETGIRVGLAYLTLGVVASPLEGFVELKLKKRKDDGTEYFCLLFSGPIRSAGGTAAAVSVLVADYVRSQMGYAEYDATEKEVKRSVAELYDYHERITNLQYLPSEEEVEFMATHLPIQVSGDASEKIEVSNYKDLDRVETNLIRSGFCLVMGECLCQKSQKLWKQLSDWGEEFSMTQWNFLKEFVDLQKRKKAKKSDEKSDGKIQPDYTYLKDLVAGRPILGWPLRAGGFRLRYGRARNTGLSSAAIHPAATYILNKFIAIGTQLKVERPGKAASLSTCDTIEGPLVRLRSGEIVRVNEVELAKKIYLEVESIIYLGDILFNYGDFFNRAHPLVPAGYCEEWWVQEVRAAGEKKLQSTDLSLIANHCGISSDRFTAILSEVADSSITADEALKITTQLQVPLHPKYTYYWNELSTEQLRSLIDWVATARKIEEQDNIVKLILPYKEDQKLALETLGVIHSTMSKEYVIVSKDDALILSRFLLNKGLPALTLKDPQEEQLTNQLSTFTKIPLRDRSGTFIGARMGRPEKAKVRKMDGQPHCLFPVGEEGGRLRSFQSALEKGKVTSDFPLYRCSCGNETLFGVCERCGSSTTKLYSCKACGKMEKEKCPKHGKNFPYSNRSIAINDLFDHTLQRLGIEDCPDLIKGVRGTSNKDHTLEHLAKGILRAKHSVPVNKDGTTRYDMTQLAITHFRPKEIGTSPESLRRLGYQQDIFGNDLVSEDQVVELFPQDIILPSCNESPEEGADEVLQRVTQYVDDLLSLHYRTDSFYHCSSKEGLVGQLVVALAPHTSAGIVARIVGFSQTQGFYAHPVFHAATRRDCDGDEACVTLLLDALLNFSRKYLPNTRGATQDAPLVLTSQLTPSEVDDMAFDVDVCSSYPLEFYEAALQYKPPWEIEIDQIGKRLNTEKQYEGMHFTHDTSDINKGVRCSSYKLLPSMQEKVHGQMNLAVKIRAVEESGVSRIVIEKHFIRDIKGNLRKFSQQQFRCVECNTKFRRPPLIGKCSSCGGKILFTISEGSIIKYLEPALSLAQHYDVPAYLKQSLELTKRRIEGYFGKDKEKQEALNRWFG